mgnify:CR=1 FL=1
MTATPDAAMSGALPVERERPLRVVSAASLFDGHDAAINMVRRLLQARGVEVVHLGHNRSVADLVRAAIQEDADAIAVSSYQGGHNEYFRYLIDCLKAQKAGHVRVIVGGGGTISADEVLALEAYGVEKIYTPAEGRRLGLAGMIEDVLARVRSPSRRSCWRFVAPTLADEAGLARSISALEGQAQTTEVARLRRALQEARAKHRVPVIGITGTGGAGKSSLTDELLQRFVRHFDDKRIAVVAIDPTRRRSGGALLGDRLRMNALASPRIFMRSLATGQHHASVSASLRDVIALYTAAQFDLIIVETAGTGQGDSEIVDHVDIPVYVMTCEFGAPSQLEKIDMLDYAHFIALNKADKPGSEDALRDVRKQWVRNHGGRARAGDENVPVFATVASRFNDPGVNRLFQALVKALPEYSPAGAVWKPGGAELPQTTPHRALIPANRIRYLSEIAERGRRTRQRWNEAAVHAANAQACRHALQCLTDTPAGDQGRIQPLPEVGGPGTDGQGAARALRRKYNESLASMGDEAVALLNAWPAQAEAARASTYAFPVRGRMQRGDNYVKSLSQNPIPKLALPSLTGWGDQLRFLAHEHLPGHYPYTAGVYPYRREHEEPIRMFAGEGAPERTNCRFHLLAAGQSATRLSTAFDSTTLYGEDPDTRPDIYGRTGNAGVSVATLDDMKKLYSGFDLCAPTTSVSMTINGPAPILLAQFMNAAIDQRVERFLKDNGRWAGVEALRDSLVATWKARDVSWPAYRRELPATHRGEGLGLLGMNPDALIEAGLLSSEEHRQLRAEVFSIVRGTVQADILKEDQAQNTCIFSTEFALRMMGDVQQYFIDHDVRNFYSVSISGYHIAEAGANPVSQLAFTLANGFTMVEYYLSRGMKIDQVAPNLSFFFSNGMDAEYAVIGRVARRIWARAMRECYGANARSQMLKYHIQTSGRSLHAQEIQFNDIRTTLQAVYALFDNCNSLHTNAYDEALTTPTEESVRRAVAIQLIINRELGLNVTQNPWSGSYAIEHLTNMVEDAVYREFDALSERGGVLGAMETLYQRGRIQDESLYYETCKDDGSLPLIGVNTFLPEASSAEQPAAAALSRSTEQEKQDQVQAVRDFHRRWADRSPQALQRLQSVAAAGGNVFEELLETVKVCSLGQITQALYQVGGQYRRSV